MTETQTPPAPDERQGDGSASEDDHGKHHREYDLESGMTYIRRNGDEAYGPIVGRALGLHTALDQLEKLAASDAPVLILGESGVGKDQFARCVHLLSGRANGPYLTENCGALADNIIESELFGHVKGGFTGAIGTRKGIFELADDGTLFLDEIGDTGSTIQKKLLRILEGGSYRRIGDTEERRTNARIVAATNRDLEELVGRGQFRLDLYHRLNVLRVEIPPLRERGDDIELLAYHFLNVYNTINKKNIQGFSDEAMDALKAYNWPGNVRELKNNIQRAVILTEGDTIKPDVLQPSVTGYNAPVRAAPYEIVGETIVIPLGATRDEVEKAHLLAVLARVGTKVAAAKSLGIGVRTVYRMMEKYGLKERPQKQG